MSEAYKKVYFVTGGGTGGHIYPAMAVADALSEEAKVYYVGNKRNMELELATKKGYKFLHVGVSGMPRKLNPKFFYWVLRLIRAVFAASRSLPGHLRTCGRRPPRGSSSLFPPCPSQLRNGPW